ncbi:MAG TPA: PorP/SprF family type IX secretion system membrane protein [Bacteroidia bacterium]|nr:PorP/SprF family type IX secretion system membrane protein [Bacteroidia bacterium]
MTRKILFAAALLFAGQRIHAQDFHLSQYDAMPLYYNPAQTGMYFGSSDDMKFRLCGSYRSQWQKLQGKPYSSVGISYDMPIQRWGVGVLMMDHIAGTSNFGTFQFLLSGAYRITSDDSKKHFLSAGIQLGLFQKRFAYDNLLFESQYTPVDGLNPYLPNEEAFDRLGIIRFDANVGIYYKYLDPNRKFDPAFGFSIYHLTTPNESFTGEKARLPMRFNFTGACDIHANEDFTITPNVLFMYQRAAMEINAGLMFGYIMPDSPYDLLAGASYRYKDGVVVHLGMKQGNNIFRVSYDIVTSPLYRFSGRRGGFEMGVIYSGAPKNGSHARANL